MLEKSGGFCKWAVGTLGTKQNFEYYELKTGQRLKSPPNYTLHPTGIRSRSRKLMNRVLRKVENKKLL